MRRYKVVEAVHDYQVFWSLPGVGLPTNSTLFPPVLRVSVWRLRQISQGEIPCGVSKPVAYAIIKSTKNPIDNATRSVSARTVASESGSMPRGRRIPREASSLTPGCRRAVRP